MRLEPIKRIAPLVAALALVVSCKQSNNDGVVPSFSSKSTRSQPETPAAHVDTAELVVKAKLEGVKAIAIANGINSLLVSDGTIRGEQGIDLEVLSLTDLRRTGAFTITGKMSNSYPWSSNSVAILPEGTIALLYNQYVDLRTFKPVIALDIQPVVGRRNVCPEPWSISPNGGLALVCVKSYRSKDESTLATFDLKSGKHLAKIATGGSIADGSACFLDNETIVSIDYDGVVIVHDLAEATAEKLPERIPQGVIQEGRHLRPLPLEGGKRLVVTGDGEMVVLGITNHSVVFRHPRSCGNVGITDDGKLLVWQQNRTKRNGAHVVTEHLLVVANAQTGEIVRECILPTFYHMIVLGDTSEFVYASHYNELHKLKIDLSPIQP